MMVLAKLLWLCCFHKPLLPSSAMVNARVAASPFHVVPRASLRYLKNLSLSKYGSTAWRRVGQSNAYALNSSSPPPADPPISVWVSVVKGEESHVGIGAVIRQGIHIGKNAVIGAGAVVIKDVPDDTTVTGVPATVRP